MEGEAVVSEDGGTGNVHSSPEKSSRVLLDEQDREDEDDAGKAENDRQDEESFEPELFERILQRLSREPVGVRVHDIVIKGNVRTKDAVIEAEFEDAKKATTMQELLQALAKANAQLEGMGIFDKCSVTLDAGPRELPGTANVIVDVEEAKRAYSGNVGMYTKPETRNWTCEGSLKWKNLLGNGETWDGTGCYGWDTTSEMSVGLHYPRFWGLPGALVARTSVLSQDWQKYSSYKEHVAGISVGLILPRQHELSYNLMWRLLQDPSHKASCSVRRQLGHSLLSSLKYMFKIDKRDSTIRPTEGYVFASTTQVSGIGPDSHLSRFVRQELELRYAIPLGFYKAALNFGFAAGMIMPWGEGYQMQVTPISDRFFMGGHSSLVCDLRGPATLLGFRSRGVGPSAVRRENAADAASADSTQNTPGRDILGGDLALNGFADLSFDLPLRFFRETGIHGHCFGCVGNLIGLAEGEMKSLSLQRFWSSLRCSVGAGIVIPLKLFRLEVNYCHVLQKVDNDRSKQGIQLSVSPY